MPCYSPLKGYKCGDTGKLVFKRDDTKEKMDVACGQCLGCRLDRSRMWASRIVHEASMHGDGVLNAFVTLTYRDIEECETIEQREHGHFLPSDRSLHKDHFQKFMKRLRKNYPGKLRYYHAGEYGSICEHGIDLSLVKCPLCNVGRPHYHAIIFGIDFPPGDLEVYSEDREGRPRHTSKLLSDTWKSGFVDVSPVNFQTAAYVARYIMKKITGDMAQHHYTRITIDGEVQQLEPEYSTMSKGIGSDWYEKYRKDLWPSDEVPVSDGKIIKKVPRFYEEKLKAEDPGLHEEVKRLRQQFRKDNLEEYTAERLWSKYQVKKAQTNLLTRD